MERGKKRLTMVSKESDTDRLSGLPDSLLCHILSFLPTKLSVATSILARRYKFLWRYVPSLDFDSAEHEIEPIHKMRFADVISRVLLLSKVRKLNSFRLTVKYGKFDIAHLLDTWIRTIIDRNVQALFIQLRHETLLPHCLFNCETLVDLRLHSCQGIIPDSIFLPNLKKLHLHHFRYESDEKLQKLISGCTVLEELNIFNNNIYEFERCTNISSPTIKWLTLKFQGYNHEPDLDYKLVINTPAVRYFVLEDTSSLHISAGIFNSLVEANVFLHKPKVAQNVNSNSMLEFVEKLCHVKCLKLTFLILSNQFPESSFATSNWNKFSNLTTLQLAADWRFLLKFLESADNLQFLLIRKKFRNDGKVWTEPAQVPTCLSSHLRQVTVHSFEYLDDDFKMIRYILKHGEVLNMMEIHAQYLDSDLALKVLKKISAFQRGSPTCELRFFEKF